MLSLETDIRFTRGREGAGTEDENGRGPPYGREGTEDHERRASVMFQVEVTLERVFQRSQRESSYTGRGTLRRVGVVAGVCVYLKRGSQEKREAYTVEVSRRNDVSCVEYHVSHV